MCKVDEANSVRFLNWTTIFLALIWWYNGSNLVGVIYCDLVATLMLFG